LSGQSLPRKSRTFGSTCDASMAKSSVSMRLALSQVACASNGALSSAP
jgi:hypothetical protein